ncbi:DUF6212 domain-containing protein [Aurantimonas sp. VKM B-3413]|uniref:DUF6212 domain-containing protein n=1 Tax=Aurantimonas sp. VKM B-3413 TaxID=2779401 RepID=UPI001E28343D|nr:DUF6212 domain-containing protein [Aurantimonas sp. VKM B-3413]MCB8839395.1 hypothetical protein [Aurantimonas sp. VKM B-3413]
MSIAHALRFDARTVETVLARPVQILIDDSLLSEVNLADLALPVSSFGPDGVLRDPAAPREREARVLSFAGIAHGVLAIAAGRGRENVARAILSVFEHHQARPLPRLVLLDEGEAGALGKALSAALMPAIAGHLSGTVALLAEREAELAAARERAEWQALALRKGRDMVEAIGYATRILAYEVPAGGRSIGPDGTITATSLAERLPVDLAAVSAVSLHVARPAAGPGRLVVTLGPPGLKESVARVELDYAALAEGWNELFLDKAVGPLHGDGFLTVSFMGEPGAPAPLLSLGDDATEGFGLTAPALDASLSLKVWKGLSDDLFREAPRPQARVTTQMPDRLAMRKGLRFLFGPAAEAVLRQRAGGGPLAEVRADGSLALRVLPQAICGAAIDAALPAGTEKLRLTAEIGYPAVAETITLALLAGGGEHGFGADGDAARRIAESVLDGGEAPAGMAATTGSLRPGVGARLSLVLDAPLRAPGDLVLLAHGGGDAAAEIVLTDLQIDRCETPASGLAAPFARRITFPELKSRLGYLFGDTEGLRVSGELGFSALDISDVENFMQTHPLPGRVSGARGRAILPSGLIRVAARFGTAHLQGPDAEYGLVLVRRDAGEADPLAFSEALSDFVETGFRQAPDFVIAGAHLAVEPGPAHMLALDLDEPLAQPADLVLTVRSLSDHTNFGWCRWYALDLVVAQPPERAHRFPAAPGGPAT